MQQAAQVYFPKIVYLQVKQVALAEGKPMATWVRDLVLKELRKTQSKRKKITELPTFSWKGVERDLSQHVDEAVYGDS